VTTLTTQGLRLRAGTRVLIDQLDIRFETGQLWAILGPNGAGKSTLLHTLAGLQPPAAGAILLDERPLALWGHRDRAKRMGILFQDSESSFPLTVRDAVLQGRHPYRADARGAVELDDQSRVQRALEEVDLAGLGQRLLQTLSGGERRRVDLATLLAQDTDIRLLDEPGNHLDLRHQIDLMSLLKKTGADRATIVTTHDINMAARYCSHALLLFGTGETAAGPTSTVLQRATLERLYGCALTEVRSGETTLFLPAVN
jgi:iron complex transport system ATP-binding protein